jgi:hypothetical protein
MPQYAVRIPNGGIELEGRLHFPDGEETPVGGVAICHPHPQYGGDMNNNVVIEIVRALLESGIAAMRFNFRGVGASEGSYGGGTHEKTDAIAAMDAVANNDLAPLKRVGLAGYSFGGGVALGAAPDAPGLAALAVVSAAGEDNPEAESLAKLTMPKLLVTGDADSFATVEKIEELAGLMPAPVETEVYPRTDHFWWGSEQQMAERVASFFRASFER